MEAFTAHTGTIAVYAADNVDTDRIIPARFLTMVTRSGYGDLLFKDVRGTDFPLDQPDAAGATVLVVGTNFGCGSSREHAVWAIQQAGFRAVVARRTQVSEGFSDIFRQNAANCGLLLVELGADVHALLAGAGSGAQVTIDLPEQRLRFGGMSFRFDIRPAAKDALVRGLDLIGTTLEHEAEISDYEKRAGRESSGGGAGGGGRSTVLKAWLCMAVLLCLSGCAAKPADVPAGPGVASPPHATDPKSPGKPKPGENRKRAYQLGALEKVDIKVGGHAFNAWLADTEAKREEGLMFVEDKEVKPNEGMIFAFSSPVKDPTHGFWMRNTVTALDIAFFGADKRLLNVGYGKPLSEKNVPSSGPFLYVLEVKAGTFARLRIKRGAKLEAPPSVMAVK